MDKCSFREHNVKFAIEIFENINDIHPVRNGAHG
jgi:predicted transcriptional regulator